MLFIPQNELSTLAEHAKGGQSANREIVSTMRNKSFLLAGKTRNNNLKARASSLKSAFHVVKYVFHVVEWLFHVVE